MCINKVEWQKPVACVPAAKARLWAAFVQDAGDYNFVNPAITTALTGIVNSKRAMEPFLTTGMGKQTTLAWGKQYCQSAKLSFTDIPATMDMKFTAKRAVQHRGRARDLRSQFSGVLKEFARCLEPLYEYLKLQAVVYRSNS